MNTPAKKSFPKKWGFFQSHSNKCEYLLALTCWIMSGMLISIFWPTKTIVMNSATSKNKVCKVSVQIIVLTPPRCVYSQIKKIETNTVTIKGTPIGAKIAICNTLTARYKRAAEPMVLDNKKNAEPVL